MDRPVYVIGHKNPDTDAICSAIGYAELLRKLGTENALAARCGEINPRTLFTLKTAGVEPPVLLSDARLKLSDLQHTDVISCSQDDSLLDGFHRMREMKLRSMPVLDEEGCILGMLSIQHMLERLLPEKDSGESHTAIHTTLARICRGVSGHFLSESDSVREQEFAIAVGAMSSRVVKERLQKRPAENLLFITGDRPTVQKPAIEYGTRCLVISGNHEPDPEIVELAKKHQVTVMISPHDTATTAFLIKCSTRVTHSMAREFLQFAPGTFLHEARGAIHDSHQDLFPVVDGEGVLRGVFSKSDLVSPTPKKVILVDHNEFSQAVPGVDEADILEVIDHHRLGGNLTTHHPIRFINEPVGSTSTIVSLMYQRNHQEPSAPVALCLASGIISDTLYLTSPTTTEQDRKVLAWLEDFAGRDLKQYASDFFRTGSPLNVLSAREVVEGDCKEYEENSWRIGVSQVEEMSLDRFWNRKEELIEALSDRIVNQSLDFGCLLITDITRHDSFLLVSGHQAITDAIEYPKLDESLYELSGVVSRKKQLLPVLVRILQSARRS